MKNIESSYGQPCSQNSRTTFHKRLIDSSVLCFDSRGVASNADEDNLDSVHFAKTLVSSLGDTRFAPKPSYLVLSRRFEQECLTFIQESFSKLAHLLPGSWIITPPSGKFKGGITNTEQYSHLATLAEACEKQPELAAILGQDHLIKPDIIVLREPEEDQMINAVENLVDKGTSNLASLRKSNGGKSIFHASISCKFTMRSDRSQNSRSEALNLIRNRKGRTPHIVVVTAEPLPSRLASLALGTGDLDFVYHIALPELKAAVDKNGSADSRESLKIMIEGKRLRDISDLPLDLAV